ncbi:MAG: hypothetical protein AAFX54_16340 [Pseudomonadota bacterium]
MALAESIVAALAIYFGAGVIVAVLFLVFGVAKLDDSAKGASIFFRPIVFLGCAALWPFIIIRWLSGRRINQPTEGQE